MVLGQMEVILSKVLHSCSYTYFCYEYIDGYHTSTYSPIQFCFKSTRCRRNNKEEKINK